MLTDRVVELERRLIVGGVVENVEADDPNKKGGDTTAYQTPMGARIGGVCIDLIKLRDRVEALTDRLGV